jgi:Glycosyltransferase family 36
MGELWAIPIMLRLCLVDNLRRLARQEVTARSERASADRWADRLVARARERSAQGLVVLAELATSAQPLTDGFITQLLKRLRDEDLPLGHALAWLDDHLTEVGRSVEELTRQERHRQATNQVSVGNCITSMRLIAALDWSSFFERTSVVERILRDDPAGAYADMDAGSRDLYRHEIERLATRSGVSEYDVARRAVARARAAGEAAERRRHVGYFLVDAGRQRLEADIGYRVTMLEHLRRVALSNPLAVYLELVSLLVLPLLAVPLTFASSGAEAGLGALPLLTVILVLSVLPATEVAITFANVAITTALRPRVLPKLSFEAGIPPTCRTVVAFGFLVTESGSGFTWYGNSQANRLTPWSNDPVSDPTGEAIYLRDDDTGRVWSPTPLPSASGAAYRVRHGQGASWFQETAFGVESNLAVFVPPDDPVKVRRLRLRNLSDRPRRLSPTVYAEWVLGATRDRAAAHVYTDWDAAVGALLARNHYVDQGRRVAFLAASEPVASFTADRAEFQGRNGSRALPAALQHGRDRSTPRMLPWTCSLTDGCRTRCSAAAFGRDLPFTSREAPTASVISCRTC